MNNEDKSNFIKDLIENLETIHKISKPAWKKIIKLFKKGDKSLGFIRRKSQFLEYYQISQTGFMKKYSKYIIPQEYNGYLLESINISQLYKKGKIQDAEKKRKKLGKTNQTALRIYNLFNTGILNMVFSEIDKLIEHGKKIQEITATASKMLDNLINDSSIIYVNAVNRTNLYDRVRTQLNNKKYCILHGSGETNTNKLKYILEKIMDDKNLNNFETKHYNNNIGGIPHFSLAIFETNSLIITEE